MSEFEQSTELNEAELLENLEIGTPEDGARQLQQKQSTANISGNEPGRIDTQIKMVIHSNIAHHVCLGRKPNIELKSYGIPGLFAYVKWINFTVGYALERDPFALQRLLYIEELIQEIDETLQQKLSYCDDLLNGMSGLTVDILGSTEPVDLKLTFSNTYSFLAARLLGKFDELAVKALTARHVGFMNNNEFFKFLPVSRIRHLFASAKFETSGLTVDDLNSESVALTAAYRKYGKLDQRLIEGQIFPSYLPKKDWMSELG